MSQIEQNTTSLRGLLEAVNNLPNGDCSGSTTTEDLDAVLTAQETKISELEAILDTKASGGSEDTIRLQTKAVTPTKNVQTILADSGYDGLDKVTVNAIPNNYIIPSGSLEVTENGTYDVTEKASVSVNVPTDGASSATPKVYCGTYKLSNIVNTHSFSHSLGVVPTRYCFFPSLNIAYKQTFGRPSSSEADVFEAIQGDNNGHAIIITDSYSTRQYERNSAYSIGGGKVTATESLFTINLGDFTVEGRIDYDLILIAD